MKAEEFRLELPELCSVARSKGFDRLKRACSLLCGHPKTGWEALLITAVVIVHNVFLIATGDVGARRIGRRWVSPWGQIGYMLLIVGAYVHSRIRRLMDAARRLDARAEELPDGEFERISDALKYAPKWTLNESEDVRCGCYGCMKMAPARMQICPFCGNHRMVIGDASHPLDENCLKAIHDLLLRGGRA